MSNSAPGDLETFVRPSAGADRLVSIPLQLSRIHRQAVVAVAQAVVAQWVDRVADGVYRSVAEDLGARDSRTVVGIGEGNGKLERAGTI